MNDRNTKGITIAALVVSILALSIGFAAFSSTLNITSGASVNPTNEFYIKFADKVEKNGDSFTSYTENKVIASSKSAGASANQEGAVINNKDGKSPVISNLSASFTAPGQSVSYTFYVVNDSNYDAYLNQIKYMKGKTCISDSESTNPATQALVDEACGGITSTVTVGGSTEIPQSLERKKYKEVVVTINYNGKYVDGAFKVTFGDIKLIYGSVIGAGVIEDIVWTKTGDLETLGSIVKSSNGEEFYVIGSTDDTVTLLATKNINTSTNKQDENSNTVSFGFDDNYENSTIKAFVDAYVTERLGLDANSGRLMTKKEAEYLQQNDPDKLYYYYGSSKIRLNYWLNTGSGYGWVNTINEGRLDEDEPILEDYSGVRPIIELPKSLIS